MTNPWLVPSERYYYAWYETVPMPVGGANGRSDAAIKAEVVDRLRRNRHTADHTIRVDVKQGVVILQGDVDSRLAKRAAGDDCWDTAGVRDVSNQLTVDASTEDHAQVVRDVMSDHVVTVPAEATAATAAALMSSNDIGDVVVVDDEERPIGIVTDRDLVVRALAVEHGTDVPAHGLMSPTLLTVRPQARVDEAVRLMTDAAVRRLPVVDDGHLVGIVSLGDLARRRDPGSALAGISAAAPRR
jgi:CBS domain-containing protein